MMKYLTATVGLLAVAASASDEADMSCYLLNGGPAGKPFPSLTQCYKQNQQACCVSAHDETIAGEYEELLSGTCIREYPELEQYYCLGCSPDADEYITYYSPNSTKPSNLETTPREYVRYVGTEALHTSATLLPKGRTGLAKVSTPKSKVRGKFGEIRLCSSFADKLLYAEGNAGNKVDAYDGCGMKKHVGDDSWGELSSTIFALTEDEVDQATGDAKLVGDQSDQVGAPTLTGNCPSTLSAAGGCVAWPTTEAADKTEGLLYISHEWKFFNERRPTYFKPEDFEISWGHAAPGDGETATCFGAAGGLQVGPMAVALVAILARMLA